MSRGQARGYARHADNTKDCPDLLAPAWVHYWKKKWYQAGQKMVVKCASNASNTTNVAGAAKENSLNIVTEKGVTTPATTITTSIIDTTASSSIQTTTAGV